MVCIWFVSIVLPDFSKGLSNIISWYLWKTWCLCIANVIGHAARPGCSKGDSIGTNTKTGSKIRGDVDGPEGAKSKVDIITLDKANKIAILVSY